MTDISFLVWNINNTAGVFYDHLTDLIKAYPDKSFDFIVLLEADKAKSTKFCKANNYSEIDLKSAVKTADNIRVLVKTGLTVGLEVEILREIEEGVDEVEMLENSFKSNDPTVKIYKQTISVKRYLRKISIQTFKLKIPNQDPVLLGAIHFPSSLYYDEYDQLQRAFEYKRKIDGLGRTFNNRVILMGDFNMTPFAPGMVESKGFYAHSSRTKVTPKPRNIDLGQSTPYYNPCWMLLGDYDLRNSQPRSGGSFYYSKSFVDKKRDWHLIDQVIFTQPLIEHFNHKNLEILSTDKIKDEVLMESARRGKNFFLDHLPLYFSFTF